MTKKETLEVLKHFWGLIVSVLSTITGIVLQSIKPLELPYLGKFSLSIIFFLISVVTSFGYSLYVIFLIIKPLKGRIKKSNLSAYISVIFMLCFILFSAFFITYNYTKSEIKKELETNYKKDLAIYERNKEKYIELKELIMEVKEKNYTDITSKYTIGFLSDGWETDYEWSHINWVYFWNWQGAGGALLKVNIIRLEDTNYRKIEAFSQDFEYYYLDIVDIEPIGSTISIEINQENAQVLEFYGKYKEEKGATPPYFSYGKVYFLLNKVNEIYDGYQIVTECYANSFEEAKQNYYKNISEFEYSLENFKLLK